MTDNNAQAIWDEYYKRIRRRRISEAEQLIRSTRDDGVCDESEVFLDFIHFSSVEADLVMLKQQLAENYEVSISRDEPSGHWMLAGTTRPVSLTISGDQLIEWIEFMADVAQSYACVFSTWVLTEASTGKQWLSELYEPDND